MNQNLESFTIPGEVSFSEDGNGLVFVDIDNPHANARLCLQGGQLLRWTPKGHEPVIWLSPQAVFTQGKAIRGGIPICWPWFGNHQLQTSFPAHGIARTAPWEVIATQKAGDTTKLVLQLPISEAMQAYWPYSCQLQLALSVGECLTMELRTRNTGADPFTISEALHTYFAVSDITNISVNGLDAATYEDKVHGGRYTQAGPIKFEGETDRVYLNTTAVCEIVDKGFKRRVIIEKSGSQSTVVWNPWAEKSAAMADILQDGYLRFVCVESGNALENALTLAPGDTHVLGASYSLASL
jgi:glucose-6-phosphate 1-epimerase